MNEKGLCSLPNLAVRSRLLKTSGVMVWADHRCAEIPKQGAFIGNAMIFDTYGTYLSQPRRRKYHIGTSALATIRPTV